MRGYSGVQLAFQYHILGMIWAGVFEGLQFAAFCVQLPAKTGSINDRYRH